MRTSSMIIFLVYILFGLYLINDSLNFVTIPASLSALNTIIILIGGILVIIGGINHLRAGRYRY